MRQTFKSRKKTLTCTPLKPAKVQLLALEIYFCFNFHLVGWCFKTRVKPCRWNFKFSSHTWGGLCSLQKTTSVLLLADPGDRKGNEQKIRCHLQNSVTSLYVPRQLWKTLQAGELEISVQYAVETWASYSGHFCDYRFELSPRHSMSQKEATWASMHVLILCREVTIYPHIHV